MKSKSYFLLLLLLGVLVEILNSGQDAKQPFPDVVHSTFDEIMGGNNVVRQLCIGCGLHSECIGKAVANEICPGNESMVEVLSCGVCL